MLGSGYLLNCSGSRNVARNGKMLAAFGQACLDSKLAVGGPSLTKLVKLGLN